MENSFPDDVLVSRFVRFLMKIGSSVDIDLSLEERRKRMSAAFILLIGMLCTSAFSLYYLSIPNYAFFSADCLAFCIFLATTLYLRKKEEAPFVYGAICIGFITICSVTTILGRADISYLLWAFVLPIIAFSVLDHNRGLVVSFLFFCLSLFFMAAPGTIVPSPPYEEQVVVRFGIIYLILTFIIYYYEKSQQMLINYIQQEKERFENASKYDPLTGLSNRRHMMAKIEVERERQLRMGKQFTLILGDIDGFKHINDTFGHETGDHVLTMIADILRNQVRGIDCPSRWGGEEFLIMLVETDLDGGQNVAERIRKKIEASVFRHQNTRFPVTMTFGLSVYQGDGDDIDACINRADHGLYIGKSEGKNKVVTT